MPVAATAVRYKQKNRAVLALPDCRARIEPRAHAVQLARLAVDHQLHKMIVRIRGFLLERNGVSDFHFPHKAFHLRRGFAVDINDLQDIILRQPDHHKPRKLLRLIELYFAAAHHNAVGLAAGIVGGIVNAGIDAADSTAVLDQRI